MAKSSYGQILKSSALIGGSSVITVLLGIVRTKVLAVLIGTEGMGLFGAFNSVTTLASSIAGMGIKTSGVRQIAEAVGTNDQERIARTARVLRRTSLVLGSLGMLALLALSSPISQATFGSTAYAGAFALLSVTILFAAVSEGQMALIQGLRRIRDLATLSVMGAVLGTICSIPIIYLFRERGIVPFLVCVSGLTIASSWWFARKVRLDPVPLPTAVVWTEAKALLGMGVMLMGAGLVANASAYLARVMVIRQLGLDAAGLYQAAFNLSGVYVSFVLGAMASDYYPRLTAIATDNTEVNRLVNEQTEAALLMALPGILGTLTFAPWVIHLLYSAQFDPAVDILRWQIFGLLGRIILWPVGFVILAKGRAGIFFLSELASGIVHLGLIWLGMKWFGLSGLGMAFFGLYLYCGLVVPIVVYRLSGFRWTEDNLRLGGGAFLATALVFLANAGGLPASWGMAIGALVTATAGFYALYRLIHRAGYSGWGDAWNGFRAMIKKKLA